MNNYSGTYKTKSGRMIEVKNNIAPNGENVSELIESGVLTLADDLPPEESVGLNAGEKLPSGVLSPNTTYVNTNPQEQSEDISGILKELAFPVGTTISDIAKWLNVDDTLAADIITAVGYSVDTVNNVLMITGLPGAGLKAGTLAIGATGRVGAKALIQAAKGIEHMIGKVKEAKGFVTGPIENAIASHLKNKGKGIIGAGKELASDLINIALRKKAHLQNKLAEVLDELKGIEKAIKQGSSPGLQKRKIELGEKAGKLQEELKNLAKYSDLTSYSPLEIAAGATGAAAQRKFSSDVLDALGEKMSGSVQDLKGGIPKFIEGAGQNVGLFPIPDTEQPIDTLPAFMLNPPEAKKAKEK